MTGALVCRGTASRRVAWTALVLALLVPARAAALSCVDARAEAGPSAGAHDGSHHPPERTTPGGAMLTLDTGVPDCVSLEVSVPALRGREPGDGGPVPVPRVVARISLAAGPPPMAFLPGRTPPIDALHPPLSPLRI